jgi:hypothetical protein
MTLYANPTLRSLIGFVGPDDNLYLVLLWTAAIQGGAGGSYQKHAAFDMIRTY